MASPFTYHPLSGNKKYIRILILQPGPWNSVIECELQTADLSDAAISYEALSYVWGEKHSPAKILLHGCEHNVTRNLETSMRYLRLTDRPRHLWVDAVCINQDDLNERAAQVKMMAAIYTRAETTVSWLGEAADDSDDAMELVRTLGDWKLAHEDEIFDDKGDDPPNNGSIQTNTDFVEWLGFPLRAQNWPAMWRLLERPYWSRVWIIQELAVRGRPTKADGRIYCGTEEVKRSQLDAATLLLMIILMSGKNVRLDTYTVDEPVKSLLVNGHPPGLIMARTLAACAGAQNRHLDYLLRVARGFKATDPRDRLFALLGLAEDGDILAPDYTANYEQVVADFVSSDIARSKTVRSILGNRFRDLSPGPSWFPDLLDEAHDSGLTLVDSHNCPFQAASHRTVLVSINHISNRLSIRGVSVGEIYKTIGPLPTLTKHLDQSNPNFTAATSAAGHPEFFHAVAAVYKSLFEPNREALWRTMCLDGDWTGLNPVFPAPAEFGVMQRVLFRYEPVPAHLYPGRPEKERYSTFVYPFVQSAQAAMAGRTFVTMKDGKMGVGPFLAQVGDVVAVVFGAPVCVVLRPVSNGQYRLVGDAYVHGVMHGEAVDGLKVDDGQVFELI